MALTGHVHELTSLRDHALGWRGLLDGLRVALERASRLGEFDVCISQVKEKFGGLRFYYEVVDPTNADHLLGYDDTTLPDVTRSQLSHVSHMVNAVESASYLLCYVCGAGATRRGSGHWIRYFCDEHDTADVVRRRGGTT